MGYRVLVVAEGSGGHLIPALEVSRTLSASGACVRLVYAQRAQSAGLFQGILEDAKEEGVQLAPVRLSSTRIRMARLTRRVWQAGRVWRLAHAQLATCAPQVVVGFGGWISVPVVFAARQRHIPVMLHEQNVRLGRANRFLLRWADEIAVSFAHTHRELNGTCLRRGRGRQARAVVTGLPIRRAIGTVSREQAARWFGLDPTATTVLILGGSQGSRPVNRFVCDMLRELTEEERTSWQFIHLTGVSDWTAVQEAYRAARLRCWVAPYLTQMDAAYALADVVVARAGASTIAELAQCGKPALFIPYPYARGHQRDNARLVESIGAGVWVEESAASPQRILTLLRTVLLDPSLQLRMGAQMRSLARPDASQRLASAIIKLATNHAHSTSLRAMVSEQSEPNHAQR